jgi:hypothetical protein
MCGYLGGAASGALGSDEPHVQVKKDMSNCTACYLDAFVYIETVPLHLCV